MLKSVVRFFGKWNKMRGACSYQTKGQSKRVQNSNTQITSSQQFKNGQQLNVSSLLKTSFQVAFHSNNLSFWLTATKGYLCYQRNWEKNSRTELFWTSKFRAPSQPWFCKFSSKPQEQHVCVSIFIPLPPQEMFHVLNNLLFNGDWHFQTTHEENWKRSKHKLNHLQFTTIILKISKTT
jgi:hypothetical protein